TDEPPLDELITAATHEYLDSGMTYDGFSEHVRTTWRNAAAYDASDRFASSVLDRLPETDPAMEVTNVWENGGHLGR
ncbi:hypothetical protein O4D07_10480, partial [Bifidobacterium breve]|nr:hypothetical protein [Bifidobacterium breve]